MSAVGMSVVEKSPAGAAQAVAPDFGMARKAMIDSQLRTSGINDPVLLAAFAAQPRERFVPEARRAVAYADRAVPLGGGRVLAPALTHGQLLAAAAPRPTDRVLLIGGGTGYLAALLAPLVASLAVVEADAALAEAAPVCAGTWHAAPLAEGAAAGAPYDLILIDGAVEQVPDALAAQLAPGGRLVTGLIERGVGRIAEGRLSGHGDGAAKVALAVRADADVALLPGFAAVRGWSF